MSTLPRPQLNNWHPAHGAWSKHSPVADHGSFLILLCFLLQWNGFLFPVRQDLCFVSLCANQTHLLSLLQHRVKHKKTKIKSLLEIRYSLTLMHVHNFTVLLWFHRTEPVQIYRSSADLYPNQHPQHVITSQINFTNTGSIKVIVLT